MNTKTPARNVTIILNGSETEIGAGNLLEALVEKGFDLRYAAIAVNEEIVPKSDLSGLIPCEGDRVEVVAPMSGG